jgi:hypothetical protein
MSLLPKRVCLYYRSAKALQRLRQTVGTGHTGVLFSSQRELVKSKPRVCSAFCRRPPCSRAALTIEGDPKT